MIQPVVLVVDADYHQINIYNGVGLLPDYAQGVAGALLVVGPAWLIIQTGCAMGWVRVTVTLGEPPELGTTPTPGWEMTEEASIAVDGELWLASFNGERRFQITSNISPGYVRVRVSCRGRALNYDAYNWTDGPNDPHEDYLVQIWPEAEPRESMVVGDDEPWSVVSPD